MFSRQHITYKKKFSITATICLILIAFEIFNIFTGRFLNSFGIHPRTTSGLIGIVASPFLHGSINHLLSNIVPFFIFSILLMHHGIRRYFLVVIGSAIAGGIMVWCIGRDAMHIGASGVVFGMFGYLIVAGFKSRELKLFLISILVCLGYGGMIYGVLPTMPGVSFEAHLFGAISGVLLALRYGRAGY